MKAARKHSTGILRHTFAGVALVLLPTSCGPGYMAPPVSPQLAKISPAPTSQLERGYAIHQAKCAKCHPFENPSNYEVNELTYDILPEMGRKAKLDMVDQKAVLAYLLAARKMPPGDTQPTRSGS